MPDLADRISRAAVSALDLAPFDDRYGRLSRQVLAGGASRFSRVIADGQALHFVLPVGLPGEQLVYGALAVQDGQLGLLWRDANGLDHSDVLPRRASTTATYMPVLVGHEEWTQFDVTTDDRTLTFLTPPVSGRLLRTTLAGVLHATPITAPSTPLTDEGTSTPTGLDTENDPEATQRMDPFETDSPAAAPTLPPESAAATIVQRPVDPPFDLYRESRSAPTPAPTAVIPTTPTPAAPLASPAPAAPVDMQYSGASRTTVGFLIGLLATLGVGGIVIIAQLLGA